MQGAEWDAVKDDVTRDLGWSSQPKLELDRLTARLDEAYTTTVAGLGDNPAVRIETVDGQPVPVLTPLAALPDVPSLRLLQSQVEARLPDIDVTELLLEMNAWTGCLDEIARADGKEPPRGLTLSLCAVLVAQACNIGLKAVARHDHPDLNLGRLAWVEQNYVRADTLVRANAKLVDAQLDLPMARRWGEGEVASADGLRGQSAGQDPERRVQQEVLWRATWHHVLQRAETRR